VNGSHTRATEFITFEVWKVTDLEASLARLEDLWRGAGMPVEEFFAVGQEERAIAGALSDADLPVPAEVLEWFSWREAKPLRTRAMAPLAPSRWYALSLEQALHERETRMKTARRLSEDFDDPAYPPSYWWEPAWLPLAVDMGPGCLAADLGVHNVSVPLRDVEWDDPEEFRTIQAATLNEAVRVWSTHFDADRCRWDAARALWEVDTDQTSDPSLAGLLR
jgi:cell wall assembly regulator SMI1